MRYQTEMMKSILTNEMAQEMIDYVSRIYGESYVGLWIYEAIGSVMGELSDISGQLRYETSPATADLLLSYWENEYNVKPNPGLTAEQRRLRIMTKIQQRGSITPERMAQAVSAALGGVPVEVTERTGKNRFTVNIREVVDSVTPAIEVIERMKPAHLIYTLQVAMQMISDAELKTAIAIVHAEMNRVEVHQ